VRAPDWQNPNPVDALLAAMFDAGAEATGAELLVERALRAVSVRAGRELTEAEVDGITADVTANPGGWLIRCIGFEIRQRKDRGSGDRKTGEQDGPSNSNRGAHAKPRNRFVKLKDRATVARIEALQRQVVLESGREGYWYFKTLHAYRGLFAEAEKFRKQDKKGPQLSYQAIARRLQRQERDRLKFHLAHGMKDHTLACGVERPGRLRRTPPAKRVRWILERCDKWGWIAQNIEAAAHQGLWKERWFATVRLAEAIRGVVSVCPRFLLHAAHDALQEELGGDEVCSTTELQRCGADLGFLIQLGDNRADLEQRHGPERWVAVACALLREHLRRQEQDHPWPEKPGRGAPLDVMVKYLTETAGSQHRRTGRPSLYPDGRPELSETQLIARYAVDHFMLGSRAFHRMLNTPEAFRPEAFAWRLHERSRKVAPVLVMSEYSRLT
jgi:hypothetical protein